MTTKCLQCGSPAKHQCSGPCGGITFCNAACQANDWHSALCLIGGKPGKKKMKMDGIPDDVFSVMSRNEAFLETLANFINFQQLQRYADTSESFNRFIVQNPKFWWIVLRRVGVIPWDEEYFVRPPQSYIDQGIAFIHARDAPNDLMFRALQVVGRNEAAMRAMLSFWGISKKEILRLTTSNRMIRDLFYNNNYFWWIVSDNIWPYNQNINYRTMVDLPEKPVKYVLKMFWNDEQDDYYNLPDISPDDKMDVDGKVSKRIDKLLSGVWRVSKYPIPIDYVHLTGSWSNLNAPNDELGSFDDSYSNLTVADMEIPRFNEHPEISKFLLTLDVNYYPPTIEVEFHGKRIQDIPFELIVLPEKWSDLSLGIPESDHLSITYESTYEVVGVPMTLRVPREIYHGSKPIEMVILKDLHKFDFNDFHFRYQEYANRPNNSIKVRVTSSQIPY
jgi:hypothetical protein